MSLRSVTCWRSLRQRLPRPGGVFRGSLDPLDTLETRSWLLDAAFRAKSSRPLGFLDPRGSPAIDASRRLGRSPRGFGKRCRCPQCRSFATFLPVSGMGRKSVPAYAPHPLARMRRYVEQSLAWLLNSHLRGCWTSRIRNVEHPVSGMSDIPSSECRGKRRWQTERCSFAFDTACRPLFSAYWRTTHPPTALSAGGWVRHRLLRQSVALGRPSVENAEVRLALGPP